MCQNSEKASRVYNNKLVHVEEDMQTWLDDD